MKNANANATASAATTATRKHAPKAAAAILALAVSCALCPAFAHAAEAPTLTASPTAAEQALQTQASSKTTMYVVSKISGSKNISYAYNKNGLVKSMSKDGAKTTYQYSGTKLKSYGKPSMRFVVEYKNGKAVKSVCTSLGGGYYDTWSYDKKGRVTTYYSHTPLAVGKIVYTYGKNGNITKATSALGGTQGSVITPTYDKKGNLTSWYRHSFKTSYNKSGRLAARTSSDGGTEKFTYKRISVPKKYVKAVKAQQRCVLNRSFGIGSYQARMFD